MDTQVQELIDKIKKDGVAQAENQKASIIKEANDKAAAIVKEAEDKAADLIKSAKAEIERFEKASNDALKQASRNMLLSFQSGLTAELDAFIKSECAKAYSHDTLKTLVTSVVTSWAKNTNASELSVLLSEKDMKESEGAFKAALKEEIAKGLTIKADKNLDAGFRIGVNNGAAFYDYSAESVASLFTEYLNPKMAAIMREAAKD